MFDNNALVISVGTKERGRESMEKNDKEERERDGSGAVERRRA